MYSKDSRDSEKVKNAQSTSPQSQLTPSKKPTTTGSRKVTEARASAQRTKLDAQAEARLHKAENEARAKPSPAKRGRGKPGSRGGVTLESAIADYLLDHIGGNSSINTIEWHRIALTLMRTYLEEDCKITRVEEVDAPDLNGWLAHLRNTPGNHGKPRAERSIQTYARSARLLPLAGAPRTHHAQSL